MTATRLLTNPKNKNKFQNYVKSRTMDSKWKVVNHLHVQSECLFP